ncbi:XRE family transcriptional regulator [Cupriavidus pauculus]|uniref:XRE family transcriptional regulator n=1 Tax=Cupriavidus pauculus TaxID=82633 RepID=A0A2N5CAI5_9BURK|nr:XRE family transcriptional regulator [Cupriavidus pauculus]PLP99216.1 XRE family transcriptional regulator [Cupriavidus pauculus]
MFSFVYGPDNVYARLGFVDAEDIPRKAAIVMDLARGLQAARVTLADAAALLRLPQSDLAMLLAGKFQHFRLDELCQWRERVRRLRIKA